jgi:16S rRNA (guanine966-N2)-methyltransferase
MARRSNQFRIIGGRWRSRQLSFIPTEGLRPTSDQGRETLFNWLSPIIVGARCLDLFAGSGALGIEALSRGAIEVIFVERHPAAVQRLRENLSLLKVDPYRVEQADALHWLRAEAQRFDLILLDPPFGQDLLAPVCAILEPRWLAPSARIYLESERTLTELTLPASWQIVREKTAGDVTYRLAVRRPDH